MRNPVLDQLQIRVWAQFLRFKIGKFWSNWNLKSKQTAIHFFVVHWVVFLRAVGAYHRPYAEACRHCSLQLFSHFRLVPAGVAPRWPRPAVRRPRRAPPDCLRLQLPRAFTPSNFEIRIFLDRGEGEVPIQPARLSSVNASHWGSTFFGDSASHIVCSRFQSEVLTNRLFSPQIAVSCIR